MTGAASLQENPASLIASSRRALFLDRDGVINVDTGYLHRIEECEFIPGVFDLARRAHALDYAIIVVTNQAGIARGLYSEEIFETFMQWMRAEFDAQGAPLADVYHCPHHPEFGGVLLRMRCACRKPAPGMLLRAAQEWNIDLAASTLVGDSATDIEAAQAAGVQQRVLFGAASTNPAHAHLDCLRATAMSEIEILLDPVTDRAFS